MQAISEILGFNYTVRLVSFLTIEKSQPSQDFSEGLSTQVEDGKYGSFDKATQTWNGMIGELQSQKVDSLSCQGGDYNYR